MIEKLWGMYESAKLEKYKLEKQMEVQDKHYYFNDIERSTKNGIANGILKSIEILEDDKHKTWKRAFEVFCKVRGKDIDTKFGFWQPLAEANPRTDETYLVTLKGEICGIDEPIVGMCGYENGKWDEEGYVLAWMPLPEAYKEGQE